MIIVYRDSEDRVKAVYENCDTDNPPQDCTRAEQDETAEIDQFYKPVQDSNKESIEGMIRRIALEEINKNG